MPLTKEILLMPRYKVIADYPKSPFDVEMVLIKSNGTNNVFTSTETVERHFVWHPENYPKIFKDLGWWENRKVEDMPMYLKQTGMVDGADNPLPDWYVKVKKHFNAGNGEWRDDSIHIFCIEKCERTHGTNMAYSGFEPVDESEYLSYTNSKK